LFDLVVAIYSCIYSCFLLFISHLQIEEYSIKCNKIPGETILGLPRITTWSDLVHLPNTSTLVQGAHAPTLQEIALKLLGHSCSSSCYERNWSTYSFCAFFENKIR